MTKEELARKKGINLKQKEAPKTAAESLLTSIPAQENKAERYNIGNEPIILVEEPEKPVASVTYPTEEQENKASEKAEKKAAEKKAAEKKSEPEKQSKAGRPKGKPSTKISLNMPDEFLELANIAAGVNYKGSLTSYIVALVEKDMEENGELYTKIKQMKK